MSQGFLPFDIHEAPLDGISLIEASAGTGKTWTITGLYVRLLLELSLEVDEILVVTYTKAATAELRARIRERLADAKRALTKGAGAGPFCQRLATRHAARTQGAVARLTRAIRRFDEAAIYTIHGFCQRVLADHAIASGTPFDTELIPNESDLLEEVVEDFWRREVYTASGLFVAYLVDRGANPQALLEEIRPHVDKPYLRIEPPASAQDFQVLEQEFADTYRACRETWMRSRSPIMALLLSGGLDGRRYRKDAIPKWCEGLDGYFRPEAHHAGSCAHLTRFAASTIAAAAKGGTPPRHPFFDACERLATLRDALFEARLVGLKADCLRFVQAELPARKRAHRVQSYGDLLNNLAAALGGPLGAPLAESVRARYRAALIDEFQDTDPVQFEIFAALYGQGEAPVFLVGDPKQAIYSFRGADIFAYLKARALTTHRYTLGVNQRSDAALIDAVGALFAHNPNPFVFEEIAYPPVSASDRARDAFTVADADGSALRFWLTPGGEDGKPLDKGMANRLAAEATAGEIARLLNLGRQSRAMIGDRALCGSDIAILVPTHRQGRLVREALAWRGVPSVQYGQDNVFASPEALDFERVLLALVEPGREPLFKAALASELMGMKGAEVYALSLDPQAWEARLETFQDYHLLWRTHGFVRMFRAWVEEEGVAARLLSHVDGERRLTNLLHLAELLQAAECDGRKSMQALAAWFSRAIHQRQPGDEETQLRLESDARLVKIVTVHTAKGLEYPVVFCPFLWDGRLSPRGTGMVMCHDAAGSHPAVLDVGGADWLAHSAQADAERLAEKIRLLYVALTRARHRCYVVWGPINGVATSALGWVLHGREVNAGAHAPLIEALRKGLNDLDGPRMRAALARVAARAPGAVGIAEIPQKGDVFRPAAAMGAAFRVRAFHRSLQATWRMTSFSALTAGRNADAPDYDAGPQAVEGSGPSRSIFSFPRGTRAGTCLHAVFETWDFRVADRAALEAHVARKLQAHGFAPEWGAPVADMVESVLTVPLDDQGFSLKTLVPSRKRAEMEFAYPLRALDAAGLRQALCGAASGLHPAFRQAAEGLTFERVLGYMKGFIDLIFEAHGRFYVLDYKSNWLGASPQAYDEAAMVATMARDHYYLQYLIYSVALHRYLRLRLPGYDPSRHFGGVFYLFLRGIRAGAPGRPGVFHDRPAASLIEALDRLIGQGEGA
ncbi:MAG: exodeoxyribonuclease V subunit beta [Betaproteobacteria bacterium]|nr:exodeoxyribonuclease V subunit beta [Betaproteobacteria bacterium]